MMEGIFLWTLVPPSQIQGKMDGIKWSDDVAKKG